MVSRTSHHTTAASRRDIAVAASMSAVATALVFVPEFFRDPAGAQTAPAVTLIWLLAVLTAAPVVAHVVARRRPAVGAGGALIVGLPQLPLVVALAMLDVWFDVRSGYLLAGSGEEAMSYGIGSTVATVVGSVLAGLVAVSSRWGARREPPPRSTGLSAPPHDMPEGRPGSLRNGL